VSNIYNNNKASNAKIGQNVNKAVYFFARFFRVNLVICFDSILSKYTSALLFSGINPSSENFLLDAEVYRLQWAEGAIATPGLNNLHTKIK
jgi:hypothetical protein